MDNEKELASPNFSPAIGAAVGTARMAQAARTGPKWLRYLMFVFIAITALATLVGLAGNLTSSIPACDAKQTRDTLSDLNRQNKFNASKYNFIRNVSISDAEVTCVASLALHDGGNVEYDYRIYKDNAKIAVQITNIRR